MAIMAQNHVDKTCTFNLSIVHAIVKDLIYIIITKKGLSSNEQLKVIQNNILNVLDNKINVNL